MENKNKKIDFINNSLNNILFYNGKLYKIIKANTANLYAFEYILNKKLEINVSIMFYNIGDKVNYYNYLNSLQPTKIKLKLKNILDTKYKIIDNINDISNLYFIVDVPNFNTENILIIPHFKDSLFNIDDKKLKDTYDIRTFINAMTTPIMNTHNEYYQKIRGEYLHNKKYFNRKYLTSEIKKLSEDELPFIKSYPIEKYNNIN